MKVRVRASFYPLLASDWAAMADLARRLTSDPASVQVHAGEEPPWLVVEFTMPTEPQYSAVERMDAQDELSLRRGDLVIEFPRTRG